MSFFCGVFAAAVKGKKYFTVVVAANRPWRQLSGRYCLK
jgi:hypothetical protein